MTIGSSPECGVTLNGSGVQSLHCTLYRSEMNEVTLVPEENSRILVDGKKIDTETNLTQGAMLTIGKSNYLRFNNPAEAQLIRSTIGSNERISMPQIDFTQDSSSNEGTPEDVIKNLNDILESQTVSTKKQSQKNNNILNSLTKIEYANINNFHSPKVFTADSITVNTPAKDVLGPKFTNFTKNLTQMFSKNDKNLDNGKGTHHNNLSNNASPTATGNRTISSASPSPVEGVPILTKVHNATANGIPHMSNGVASPTPKLQPSSACYDRYPKPGSYGSLQVFPMNGVNSEINNGARDFGVELQRQRAQLERMHEQEVSKMEQDRLEEIMRMCADFERQNQSVQSSPIVQNRIKTNGSLPRDKKSPFTDHTSSPNQANVFFPPSPGEVPHQARNGGGYENVKLIAGRRVELLSSPSPTGRYANGNSPQNSPPAEDSPQNGKVSSGYENVLATRKQPGSYVPQSPRTKIKTCISPKKEPMTPRKAEYDLLVQSFEEKLRLEIQQLRENRIVENGKAAQNGTSSTNQKVATSTPEHIYGTLGIRNKNVNHLTVNIKKNLDDKQISQLKKQRVDVMKTIRDLKAEISELQRQEEEVLREVQFANSCFYC